MCRQEMVQTWTFQLQNGRHTKTKYKCLQSDKRKLFGTSRLPRVITYVSKYVLNDSTVVDFASPPTKSLPSLPVVELINFPVALSLSLAATSSADILPLLNFIKLSGNQTRVKKFLFFRQVHCHRKCYDWSKPTGLTHYE